MINFNNNGDGTGTVTIQYTNDITKLAKGFEYAAKYIFGGDSRNIYNPELQVDETFYFDDLTNQEKLDILNDWIRDQLLTQARKQIEVDKHTQASIDAANDDTIIV